MNLGDWCNDGAKPKIPSASKLVWLEEASAWPTSFYLPRVFSRRRGLTSEQVAHHRDFFRQYPVKGTCFLTRI